MEIGNFIKYLEDVKRYSPNTLLAYKKDILQFVDYCNTVESVDEWKSVTPKMVRRWVVVLMTGATAISPKSVRRKLSALSAVFRYLLSQGLVDDNPVDTVALPKVPQKLPVFVLPEQLDSLLDGEEFADENFSEIRDRAILLTAYITGMRRSELVALKVTDIDFPSMFIKVTGKGDKQRVVPMTNELFLYIKKYMECRSRVVLGNHDYLFITDKGTPVYEKFVYRLVVRYLASVTTQKKRSPHVLRHSFATALLNNGACIEAIRKLLGHTNLSATQVYTHTSMEGLKRIYNRAHPRASDGDEVEP